MDKKTKEAVSGKRPFSPSRDEEGKQEYMKRNHYLKLKNIRLKGLVPNMVITLAYPVIKTLISSANKMLIFLDALTIMSFLLLILGIFNRLNLKGDFDRIQYTLNASLHRVRKPFDAFQKDKEEERETQFNYILFLGLLYLGFSVAASLLFY